MESNSTEPRTGPREASRFGSVVFFFFGALFALSIWRQRPVPACFFGFLWILGLCCLLFPALARPVYTGWLKCSHFTGRIVTVLLLTLAYLLVITPSAWLKRALGGRPLPLKPDRGASSYWVERKEPAQPRERFLKRF
jgi:peptidoglycan/LPS O-acetylase OafA/YrhL